MERNDLLLDPKWISSFYALVATAVCILIFTYKGVNFFDAFIKTFFTVISFYLFGLITAAGVNFYSVSFRRRGSTENSKIEKASKVKVEGEVQQQENEHQI